MSVKGFTRTNIQYHYSAPSSTFFPKGEMLDRPMGQVLELARRFRVLCLTLMLVVLSLLMECSLLLHKKVPPLLIAEHIQGGGIERVVQLPYDEQRALRFCSGEIKEGQCIEHAK